MLKGLGLILCCSLITTLIGDVFANEARNVNLIQEAQQFPQSQKVAVVVGVNQYSRSSGLRPLKYAVADANLMTKALQRHGYIVKTLINSNATRGDILNMIEQVGKTLPRNQGTLTFFFSGHGFSENQKNYLATFGTIASRINSTALSLDEVEREIRKTGARRAVMFIDACRELPRTDGIKGGRQLSFIQQQSEGIKALYSTKFGELSYETPQLGHGVFSHFLYRGLNGHAVEQDGIISFDSLKRYVQQETANWTLQHLDKTQKPFTRERSDNFGVFVLGQMFPLKKTEKAKPKEDSFEKNMVYIKGGEALIGCLSGIACDDDTFPRKANVKGFWIGRYEVTFDEWNKCVAESSCRKITAENANSYGRIPVSNVMWGDIKKYLAWLNKRTGKNYRLPTEVEWEYAARANVKTKYPWGNSLDCKKTRIGHCHENFSPVNVGRYPPNKFNLYDVFGNVWEWTCSKKGSGYSNKCAPENYLGERILKGASYDSTDHLGLSSRWTWESSGEKLPIDFGFGFRLAHDL